MIRDQFLGKTDDRKGKEGGDGHGDDATDKGDEVGGSVRVFFNKLGDMAVHLYTSFGTNDEKKYPRPN